MQCSLLCLSILLVFFCGHDTLINKDTSYVDQIQIINQHGITFVYFRIHSNTYMDP